MDLESIDEQIAAVHRGRAWIVTSDAAVATTAAVERLRQHGARGVMVVAGVEGAGDLPNADRIHYTRSGGSTMMDGIRRFVRSIESPNAGLVDAVDAFDPHRRARVLGPGFSRKDTLAGRPVFGARRPSWGALEDKTTVDEIWRAASVATAPSAVVPVAEAPRVAGDLDIGLGTVWAADNTEGWHGGGEYTKWVAGPADVERAVEWFGSHASTVRVMPFLEGIPCSIHAFVTRDGIAVFDPVELYILRTEEPRTLSYARLGNFWSPPPGIVDEMRSAARGVAHVLIESVGYLGGFGIDGIATVDGFRPTELNPRLSVGLGIQAAAAKVPLGDLERGVIEGHLDVSASDLEDTIRSAVSTSRTGAFMFRTDAAIDEREFGFVFEGDTATVVADDAECDGRMRSGPAPFGSVVFARLESGRIDVGPSTAPLAIPLIELANEVFACGLPAVEPAVDVLAE